MRLQLVAAIYSAERMELEQGCESLALIKSSWVLLSEDLAIRTSARNQLHGVVSQITRGEVNAEVTLDLGDGKTITAMVTTPSIEELDLKPGKPACALFKASSVILMRA